MTRNMLTELTVLLTLALQVRAQLLNCADVKCPMKYGSSDCRAEDTLLTQIGVANFSSALTPYPLSWTIGYAPKLFDARTDERRYYLGAPGWLDLEGRTDVNGCALFFTGIEAGLSFVKPNGSYVNKGTSSGSCADALGITCETDLITQAQRLLGNSTVSDELQCSDLASILQSSPPESCTLAGTWGNITTKVITGPNSPSAVQLADCNPAGNATYRVRDVARFPTIGEQPSSLYITPLMTIFTPAGGNATGDLTSPEVHLNCMKPVLTEPPNQLVRQGNAKAVRLRKSLLSIPISLMGFLTAAVFVV